MSSKKSQGISIHVLIVAALALVVLIVLIAIFTGRLNLFSKSYGATTERAQEDVCTARGCICYSTVGGVACPSTAPDELTPATQWIDCSANQRCCKKE